MNVYRKSIPRQLQLSTYRKNCIWLMMKMYAFGDSSNDLDMIKAAGHGVIMGHHDPVLEPYAEYITDTVENDGLYKAMEHYGLI